MTYTNKPINIERERERQNLNNNYQNSGFGSSPEVEKILNQRDRQKYLEELSELESELASVHRRIFYAALNLLIIDPAATAGLVWYL